MPTLRTLLRRFPLLIALIAVIACRTTPAAAPPAGKPNVVVILADDQGWGDLSIHGNTNLSTPNIDSLGRDGALFDRFFVCPVCAPTRAEFLTGRYHPRSGVSGVSEGYERMNADEVTIADTFNAAGYVTGAFGKWHNGTQPPLHPNNRGFDEYYGFTHGHWGLYFDPPLDHNGQHVRGSGYITDDLATHAISFIEQNKDRPFFCYVPFNVPHSPFQVPDRFYQKFDGFEPKLWTREKKMEDLTTTRAALAMVESLDWNVGRILAALDQLKLADNTIVVYFSDNGPNTWRWNGDMKGKKGMIDEGGIRSPFLVRWPGHIKAGTKVPQIAAAIDLLPTLTDLAGVPLMSKKSLDGKSLKPLLLGDSKEWPDRVICSYKGGGKGGGGFSVRNQQYRLDADGQLFDMVADPGQRTDVAAQHPDVVTAMTTAGKQYAKEMSESLAKNRDRPFHVGYGPSTTLPARDGIPHDGVKRSAGAPNNSYFTHWTDAKGSITWKVQVGKTADYDVILYYTCKADSVGASITLASGQGPSLDGKITEAFDPPFRDLGHDRADRGGESHVKDFKPLNLGKLRLTEGTTTLTLKATDIPGDQVADVLEIELNLAK